MTDITTNENVYNASQNDAVNTENEKEKMFTQEKLDEIIAERLSRERKVNEALNSVKTLLKSAAEKGYIKGTSYAEMAKELAEKLRRGSEECEKAEAQENAGAGETETVPQNECQDDMALLTAICEDNSEDAAQEEKEDVREELTDVESVKEERKETDNSFTAVLSDLKSRYPKEKVEKLLTGDLFERFAKGRSGSMREIADDFFSFISSVNADGEGDDKPSEYSSFTSTAFSSMSGTPSDVALTKQQMEIAKSAGMSYREYANLLSSVPKRTRTVF